jgi:hypothetical protein
MVRRRRQQLHHPRVRPHNIGVRLHVLCRVLALNSALGLRRIDIAHCRKLEIVAATEITDVTAACASHADNGEIDLSLADQSRPLRLAAICRRSQEFTTIHSRSSCAFRKSKASRATVSPSGLKSKTSTESQPW